MPESFDKKSLATLEAVSIVAASDQKPYVQLKHNGKTLTQLDSNTARQFAMILLEAAEAAEQDALLWKKLDQMEIANEVIGNFIADLREKRVAFRREQYGIIQ